MDSYCSITCIPIIAARQRKDLRLMDKLKKVSNVSLWEIASWQINADKPSRLTIGSDSPKVELPALQKGFVWKFHQVEALWDSLICKMPTGSLLLAKYNNQQALASPDKRPDYFLLDGQQRATAIGLGFATHWEEKLETPANDPDQQSAKPDSTLALWLDLAEPDQKDNDYVSWKDRKAVAADLKNIYNAASNNEYARPFIRLMQ